MLPIMENELIEIHCRFGGRVARHAAVLYFGRLAIDAMLDEGD